MNAIITLKEYLNKGTTFVIPDYQRGYVWGKIRAGEKDSVTNLLDDLMQRFPHNTDVFLQGVTVTETVTRTDREIILIDGQQRTTCLYLLLKWLGYKGPFKIQYAVRQASNDFLCTLEDLNLQEVVENEQEEFQDIFFFKKTLRIIKEKLKKIDPEQFRQFLLEHVKFLYINVPEEQAIKIFTMMNGNKAKMLPEEIIKAEILRLVSQNNNGDSDYAQEWELNMLRSRYAREWDKWLRWWNRDDVRQLYKCSNPMGLLVSSYLRQQKNEVLTFESFKNTCLRQASVKEAKDTFDGLRRLQKRFEDAFNAPETYNRIGAILSLLNSEDQNKFINYYFVEDHRNKDSLKDYYLLAFLGMSHEAIVNKDTKQFTSKYDTTWNAIGDHALYWNYPVIAFKLLLRLNVDQDILQNRKFNFQIWKERSLEHIFPKSKVVHPDESNVGQEDDGERDNEQFLRRDQIKTTIQGETFTATEHSIGNLVLLYKNENSKFNNSNFEQKKEMFFNPKRTELFKSKHLLHTVCVFAEKLKWDGPAIAQNQYNTLEAFKRDYAQLIKAYEDEKQD